MGRWHSMAVRHGTWLGALYNRNMRETLKAGVHALVANTHMDSGRAAAHWMIIPSKGGSPGSYAQMRFPNLDYGQGPVGHRGSRGANRGEVISSVVEREWARVISKSISGRNPATRFLFQSSVPETFDDRTKQQGGSGTNYRVNARLAAAQEAALSVMDRKFNALAAAGRQRVNTLG